MSRAAKTFTPKRGQYLAFMRRRKLKWLWARLKQIAALDLTREELLMKLGAARAKARAAWRLIDVEVSPDDTAFSFALNREKLRQTRRREGRYLYSLFVVNW